MHKSNRENTTFVLSKFVRTLEKLHDLKILTITSSNVNSRHKFM